MDLYKSKIPIVYRDLNEGWIRGRPVEEMSTGAVPRDFSIDPVEMRDSPDQMKVYSESEWDAIYDEKQATESGLEHILLRALENNQFEFLDQNGFPDCWCHSTAHAVMLDRLKQNLPYVKLNAVALATLIGRLDGGWCGLSMKYVRNNGAPVVGTGEGEWPYQSRRGQDTPALRANMAKFKGLEDWYDMGRAEWDQQLAKSQFTTCLFNNLPTPSDYNRYGHSMLSLDYVRIEKGLWGPLTLNSWKDYGYHGLVVLANHVPDGSCALRSSTPSA